MTQIDQRLTRLMDVLLQSSIAPLATDALGRMQLAEAEALARDGEHDPFAPQFAESPDQRARRQLALFDYVVTDRIKLELALLERSLSLARELGAGIGERGAESLATVMIVNERATTEESETGLDGVNLLTRARRESLEKLLMAWRRSVDITRRSIDGLEA